MMKHRMSGYNENKNPKKNHTKNETKRNRKWKKRKKIDANRMNQAIYRGKTTKHAITNNPSSGAS